jgi:hypothetical protein
MSERIIQDMKFVQAVAPAADALSGTVTGNVVNMRDATQATWIINTGDVDSGTSVVKAYSCSDSACSVATEIAFRYKRQTDGTVDTFGDEATSVVATGITLAAAEDNRLDIIEIDASDLSGTDQYATIKLVQGTDHPRATGVICILSGLRQKGDDKRTARI